MYTKPMTGMETAVGGRRRRMARAERSEQLLVTAEAVFAERGIGAASMDEIAERAGVTKPILYDHFGSKEGLLAAVIERGGGELREAIAAAVGAAPNARGALRRGLEAYFVFISAHRASWTALLAETSMAGLAGSALERVREEQADFIAALIRLEIADIEEARANTYAEAVIGACERLATSSRTGSLPPEVLAENVTDLVWRGFSSLIS